MLNYERHLLVMTIMVIIAVVAAIAMVILDIPLPFMGNG